jgi:hypothetical protein
MKIEERELNYSPAAPLRAWRLVRIRPDGGGVVLSSPMFHNPQPVPWPHAVKKVCHEGHPAPRLGCRCGIYGAVRGTLDSLPGYLVDTAYERDPWAYGEIGCSGRVFVDVRGVRAERAEILRLASLTRSRDGRRLGCLRPATASPSSGSMRFLHGSSGTSVRVVRHPAICRFSTSTR